MGQDTASTRRSFLRGGALLAGPIAAGLMPAAALADDGLQARVSRLEDEAAIRDLHRSWLRRANGGAGDARLDKTVRRITPDHAGEPERIDFAADAKCAVVSTHCVVELESALPPDCTLAQMAHAQGHGTVRRTECGLLTVGCTKSGSTWKIAKVALLTP